MADKSFDPDDLVAEIRKELGVRVERSDPILAASVVNDFMLRRTLDTFSREMKAQNSQYLAAIAQTPKAAEKAAVEMLNRSANWMDERIKIATEAAVAQIVQAGEAASAAITREKQKEVAQRERFAWYVRLGATGLMIVVALAIAWPVGVMIGNMLPLPAKH